MNKNNYNMEYNETTKEILTIVLAKHSELKDYITQDGVILADPSADAEILSAILRYAVAEAKVLSGKTYLKSDLSAGYSQENIDEIINIEGDEYLNQLDAFRTEYIKLHPECPKSADLELLDIVTSSDVTQEILQGKRKVLLIPFEEYKDKLIDKASVDYLNKQANKPEGSDIIVDDEFCDPLRQVLSVCLHDENNTWKVEVKCTLNDYLDLDEESIRFLHHYFNCHDLDAEYMHCEKNNVPINSRNQYFYLAMGDVVSSNLEIDTQTDLCDSEKNELMQSLLSEHPAVLAEVVKIHNEMSKYISEDGSLISPSTIPQTKIKRILEYAEDVLFNYEEQQELLEEQLNENIDNVEVDESLEEYIQREEEEEEKLWREENPDCPPAEEVECLDMVIPKEIALQIKNGSRDYILFPDNEEFRNIFEDKGAMAYLEKRKQTCEPRDIYYGFNSYFFEFKMVWHYHFHDADNTWFLDIDGGSVSGVRACREDVKWLQRGHNCHELDDILQQEQSARIRIDNRSKFILTTFWTDEIKTNL